jgi:hypothetical protein
MPYSDPERQKAAKAASYRRRYRSSAEFREQEAERKREWLESDGGKQSNAQSSRRARLRKKRELPSPKQEALSFPSAD